MSAQPLEVRIASLEGSYRQVSDRLNSIDRRLDGFEQKMEGRFNLILGTWITVMASLFFNH
jgi:hypothetical protein